MDDRPLHPPPSSCPTCQSSMHVRSLQCDSCGTEVRGRFQRCEFCRLTDKQRELLWVFLSARGNVKELERHLGVSYPTARARLDDLLAALGISEEPLSKPSRKEVLSAVAAGEIDVESALDQLKRT